MPAPKDPERYAEYIRKQSESHKGRVPPNKGKPLSEEQKAHLSAINTGKKHKPETIEKLRKISSRPRPELRGRPAYNKGVPMSEEQKAKLSAARKGVKSTPEAIAKRSAGLKAKYASGYTPSAEVRAKIGAKHKGKIVSEETRAKITASQLGKPPHRKDYTISEETREKMRSNGLKQWDLMAPEQKAQKVDILREASKNITNSWIENVVAQRLDSQGVTYERQKLIGWYRVDFYIEAENRIIEVNGCYFHCCEQCQQKGKSVRADYEKKRESDRKRYAYLCRKGYTVDVIWEHDLPRKR